MEKLFYLILLALFTTGLFAQQTLEHCAFEPDPATIQRMNQHHDAIARFKADPASSNRLREVKRVPLRFVAFNAGKTAGLSQADVNLAVSTLNKAFLPAGIEFFSCQAPINVISSPYANYLISEERALWQEFKASKVINVFCVESIEYGTVAGYTYLPGSGAPEAVFMLRTHLSQPTFAHEMGHYYGLYHTHGKSNCETLTDELVNGSNCEKAGDDVCDTPADPNLQGLGCYGSLVNSATCTYTGTAKDKNGDLFKPDPKNIMSYAPSRCKTDLTPGQYERIRYFSQFRIYPEECPTALCTTPTITSVDSTYNSLKLSWTAFAEDSLYQLRYRLMGDTAWKTTNLTSNQWALSNLKACTKLEVQVRRACGVSFSNWGNTLALKTLGCGGTYCASYGGKSNIWINRLSVENWDHTSGDDDGYLLYPSTAFSFTTGKPYSFQLEPGGSIRIRDSLHWQIWVDKNLDRDFDDPNELMYQGKSVQRIAHKASFELPADIQSGNSRMRIILSLNKFVASPCDSNATVLETEDYPIRLLGKQVCVNPTATNLILQKVTTNSVNIKARSLDATRYQWELKTSAGQLTYRSSELIIDSLYYSGLTENTSYEARLRIVCKNGIYSSWSDPLIFNTLSVPCPAPDSNLLKASAITSSSVQINCGIQSEAIYYRFYYRIKGTEAWTETALYQPPSVTLVNLKAGTTYEYRVRIYCTRTLATTSPYSQIRTFTTVPEPCRLPSRDLILVQMLGDTVMQFSYGDGNQYYPSKLWRYRKRGTSSWTILPTGLSSVKIPEFGETFEVAMQGTCASGLQSDWSTSKTFNTPCIKPKLSDLVIAQLRYSQIRIACRDAVKRRGFYWQYKRLEDANWPTEVWISDTTITIGSLTPLQTYQFRLRSQCTTLESSVYSDVLTFTTPEYPCPVPDVASFKATFVTDISALLSCAPVPNAQLYIFSYRKKGSKNWISVYGSKPDQGRINKLDNNTVYEFTIQSACAFGNVLEISPYQPLMEFKTLPKICPKPLVSQIQWQLVQDSTLRFEVQSTDYESVYWRYRKQGSREWLSLADSTIRKGLPLNVGQAYEISVQGLCANLGTSLWSDSLLITGPCPPVSISSIQVKEIGAHYAEIECDAKNIAGFNWRHRLKGKGDWTWVNGSGQKVYFAGLSSNSTYEFQVQRVCNLDDESQFTESLNFVTLEQACEPIDAGYLYASKLTAHSATVSCKPSPGDGPKQYVLAFRVFGQQDWIQMAAQDHTNWQLDSLQANSNYEYRVGVRCDSGKELAWCASVEFTTLPSNFCPAPEPDQLNSYYETPTHLRLDYPLHPGEQMSWHYRQAGDSIWHALSNVRNLTLQLDPKFVYEVSLQRGCVDGLKSDWSATSTFRALCHLGFESIKIEEKAAGSIDVNCTMPGQGYLWAYRRQGQDQWEQQTWTTTDRLTLNGLIPGLTYTIGTRVLCYQGDTTMWVFQTYRPLCDTLTAADIQIDAQALYSASFKCTNYGYERYEWRYRPAGSTSEWIYLQKSEPVVSQLLMPMYELQVRGFCRKDENWSAWSNSTLFSPGNCTAPDSLYFAFNFIDANAVGILVENRKVAWYANQFRWYYRIVGQKSWIDSLDNGENYLILRNLLPGAHYEVLLKITCNSLHKLQKTYASTFTMPAECFVPNSQSIQIQKLTHQSVEIALNLGYSREYEVRYRVKGSSDAYQTARGTTWVPALLHQLSPETDYEIMLRIVCKQDILWSEVFYIHTKACGIPYEGRIILSTITQDSIKAYVEAYDFNPTLSGVTYTWRYKLAPSNNWQQVFTNTHNTITIQSLNAGEYYELQALLQCKSNTNDSILFATSFITVNSECSTLPNETWIERTFEGINNGFRIRCNLPEGYRISIRYWVTDRQNVINGNIAYLNPLSCTPLSDIAFNFDVRDLLKFQFRVICPDGNIGPWSKVTTLDQLQGANDQNLGIKPPTSTQISQTAVPKLWPNPTSGKVYLQIPTSMQVELMLNIFGADGRKVMTKQVAAYDQMPLELDLSGQAAGLYFIRVQAGKNLFTQRILLQKP